MHIGTRGTGDWGPSVRPLNWREQILYLYPNGSAPLTAILSMMSSQSVDDPQFSWWTQVMGSVHGGIVGLFTDPQLTKPYAGGGTKGTILYVKVAEELAKGIREGHQVFLRVLTDHNSDTNVKVLSSVLNKENSYISARLLEADPANLKSASYLVVIGNINPEGGSMPSAIALDPKLCDNRTQIFRTPLSITRTARKTKLRTGNDYQKAKKECLEMHSIECELAYIFSIMTEEIGANGKPERTTDGIISFMKKYAKQNIFDYAADPAYKGKKWLESGKHWFDRAIEVIFRYGAGEKVVFCGSGALLGIQDLAQQFGHIYLEPEAKTYGVSVLKWVSPFGTVNFKTHPLFSYDPANRFMMVVVEPRYTKYRYIDDTMFFSQEDKVSSSGQRLDATNEEYLTEAGLEYHYPVTGGVLYNVGQDNLMTTEDQKLAERTLGDIGLTPGAAAGATKAGVKPANIPPSV